MIGVYWGAFDPPTEAHFAIIYASLKDIPLKKLYVIVNNNRYKNYSNSLEDRIKRLEKMIHSSEIKNVKILWQDDEHKLDYEALRERIKDPLCAIAGYDAYQSWAQYSTPEERAMYHAIAVVPRGDDLPVLTDHNAFVLPIDYVYRYVSSTKAKGDRLI